MSNIVIIGFATEGKTDSRFLENVIRRTFEEVALDCISSLEIHSVQYIPTLKEDFETEIVGAAKTASEIGVMVLCIHTDSDDRDDANVFQYKISPAFEAVQNAGEEICKNLVPIVPIQMTEAWMLADPETLKEEIGTEKSINDLNYIVVLKK